MIVRSRFVVLDGQAMHLARTDTNRRVILRHDLFRDAPLDLRDATRFFSAIARTNLRAKRDMVHIKISPSHDMTDQEIRYTLALIEKEHGISGTMPRLVVQHAKGDRPDHFHVIWPLVDPETGRAIQSKENYVTDELVSRVLELRFHEAIVPGPRMEEVVEILTQRGQVDEASALAGIAPVKTGGRLGDGARQQGGKLGIDPVKFGMEVESIWSAAGGDPKTFVANISLVGMRLAAGDKAVMIVDDRTGYSAPLARQVQQFAKAAGHTVKIRKEDLRTSFPDLPALKDAIQAGLADANSRATAGVSFEFDLLTAEAKIDGQGDLAERLKKARARARDKRKSAIKATLKARRAEIRALFRQRDRIRRARIGRAFRAAHWIDNQGARKLAFLLASSAALIAGGGLGIALLAGGMAIGALPTYERARAIKRLAEIERNADLADQKALLDRTYEATAQESAGAGEGIDLKMYSASERTLIGFVAHSAIRATEGELGVDETHRLARARNLLGAALVGRIEANVFKGNGALTLLRLCDPNSVKGQVAIEKALTGLAGDGTAPASTDEQGKIPTDKPVNASARETPDRPKPVRRNPRRRRGIER